MGNSKNISPAPRGTVVSILHISSVGIVNLLREMQRVPKIAILNVRVAAYKGIRVSVESGARLVRAARFVGRHGARLGYAASTLILSTLGLIATARSFSGAWLIIWCVGILGLAVLSMWLFVRSVIAEDQRGKNEEDLRDQIEELDEQKADLEDTVSIFQEQYTTLFAGLLSILANQVLSYGPTERVSVYRHDAHKGGFRMVSRYSDSPEYDKPSERTFYPDDEGAIGKAWKEGRLVVAELPDPESDQNEYLKKSEQEWRIKREVAERFKMKSCCYAAFPLTHPHGDEYGNIAVLSLRAHERTVYK
jgi:hypothetical protein